jgi:hypothetical protein
MPGRLKATLLIWFYRPILQSSLFFDSGSEDHVIRYSAPLSIKGFGAARRNRFGDLCFKHWEAFRELYHDIYQTWCHAVGDKEVLSEKEYQGYGRIFEKYSRDRHRYVSNFFKLLLDMNDVSTKDINDIKPYSHTDTIQNWLMAFLVLILTILFLKAGR